MPPRTQEYNNDDWKCVVGGGGRGLTFLYVTPASCSCGGGGSGGGGRGLTFLYVTPASSCVSGPQEHKNITTTIGKLKTAIKPTNRFPLWSRVLVVVVVVVMVTARG